MSRQSQPSPKPEFSLKRQSTKPLRHQLFFYHQGFEPLAFFDSHFSMLRLQPPFMSGAGASPISPEKCRKAIGQCIR